jgi:hypothetical protein
LDLIYLLFSHTPNLWDLCQCQGPGTDPNGRIQIQLLSSRDFWVALCVGINAPTQWPRGLRHELSSFAWILGSWVRIPQESWMYVRVSFVFVLSCVGNGVATGLIPRPRSLTICLWQRFRKCAGGGGVLFEWKIILSEIQSNFVKVLCFFEIF